MDPDNKALGQAFKKKFDKNFKKALSELTNDQIKGLLRDGKIDINGNEVTTEMIKVVKAFTNDVKKDKSWGCETKGTANVMLAVQLTPELKCQGLSREITNRI